MQLDLFICYFFCYAVIGYIIEVLYCSFYEKRLVNRGFLHGPYLPIYGFGSLIILLLFQNKTTHPLLVFVLTFILTSMLEYVTSYLLERLFNAKLWDYSTYRFNLHGRVCLLNSTLFGLLGLLVIYGIHPFVSEVIQSMEPRLLNTLSTAIVVVVSIDATSSVFQMAAFQKQLGDFRQKAKEIEERLGLLKLSGNKHLEQLALRLDEELEELKVRLDSASRRILDAFLSITSSNEEKRLQFENLKQHAKEWRQLRKAFTRRHTKRD